MNLQSTKEKGQIRVELHPEEDGVKVFLFQGDYKQVHHVSDELFLLTGMKPDMRNIHATIECFVRETGFLIDKDKPRKQELQRFLVYLSQSKEEEMRELATQLSVFLIDEWNMFVIVFVVFVIIVLVYTAYSQQSR
nr:putative membrane protein [Cedratvirus lena]